MADIVKAILALLSSKGETSIDDIVRELDMDRDKVISAISTLANLGLIDVKGSDGILVRLHSDARKILD